MDNKKIKNKKEVISVTIHVKRWGNSLGLRIPKQVVKKYGIVDGSQFELKTEEDKIILKPIEKVPTLEELMAQITEENQHNEIDFGKPEGKEIW